jgi:hypothetical protein
LLEIVDLTSPVSPNSQARLVAKTLPGADCTITVIYSSGPSKAQGLEPTPADDEGNVSWTWKVGVRTTPGSWKVTVSASLGGENAQQVATLVVQ